uniref:Uncharacterized protein n=1 Tax=Cacopsylla melanoneura TaxID=428564 RepID=A0A8D8Z9P7_9HEMI
MAVSSSQTSAFLSPYLVSYIFFMSMLVVSPTVLMIPSFRSFSVARALIPVTSIGLLVVIVLAPTSVPSCLPCILSLISFISWSPFPFSVLTRISSLVVLVVPWI